jgi:predicted component of type VI protein secretion system
MIKIQAIQLSPPIATKVANLHPEELFRGECLIGSSPNCHLVIDDSEVCGIHGKIFCYQQQYYFTDLASGQGSLINDDVAQINQNYLLKMGDLLRLGDSVLLVEAVVLGSEAFNAPELNSKLRTLIKMLIQIHPLVSGLFSIICHLKIY